MKIKLTAGERATKVALAGKRIARVNLHPFDPNCEGSHAIREHCTDPVIVFDDGSSLEFRVQETEIGEYGIALVYHPSPRAKKALASEGERA